MLRLTVASLSKNNAVYYMVVNTFIREVSSRFAETDSPKLGFRVRVRVSVSANRVSANRD